MALDKSTLRRILGSARGKPLTVEELMQRGKIDPGAKQGVKKSLRELHSAREVELQGKRWVIAHAEKPRAAPAPPPQPQQRPERKPQPGRKPAQRGAAAAAGRKTLLGTLKRHPEGYGFLVLADGAMEDVFLPPPELRDAMDGDLLRIEIVRGRGGRSAGQLVEIVQRRRTHLVGVYAARGRGGFVVPLERSLPGPVQVAPRKDAKDGQVVNVRITRYPERGKQMEGAIEDILGAAGSSEVETLMVVQSNGFATEFPAAVLADASRVPAEVQESERAGRRDLRNLALVTIDGEDARDFDDAVYVEQVPAGWRLVVAIADVAHYVRHGSALDGEALKRATSVYFPSRVVPMLPERLSNGICSLNPDVDRLCMVADMALDPEGRPLDVELYQGVMRSAARLTYTQVAKALSGEKVPGLEKLAPSIALMGRLSERMTLMREKRGSIDLDIAEAKVVLDDKGRVVAMARRERNLANRLVEEFMLAANEAVARYFATRGLPTLYRVHGEPDVEKLAHFAAMARLHGFALEPGGELQPKAINAFLKRVAGRPEQKALNMMLLRSMMQALYSAENIGHYGLAAPFYLHFTSPIRRYPDLIVHRLLKRHWAGERQWTEEELGGIAAQSSERERAAMDAEREILSYYAAVFMQDKVGQEFPGTVAGVADFGLFVELTEHAVEGLVRSEQIGSGWEHDEATHTLRFPGSGRMFKVGDKVRILVAAADPARRKVDFSLVLADGKTAPAPEPPAPRGKKRPPRR